MVIPSGVYTNQSVVIKSTAQKIAYKGLLEYIRLSSMESSNLAISFHVESASILQSPPCNPHVVQRKEIRTPFQPSKHESSIKLAINLLSCNCTLAICANATYCHAICTFVVVFCRTPRGCVVDAVICHVDQGYRTLPFLHRQMSHILVDHIIHVPLIGNDFPAIDMQLTCI